MEYKKVKKVLIQFNKQLDFEEDREKKGDQRGNRYKELFLLEEKSNYFVLIVICHEGRSNREDKVEDTGK